MADPVGEDGVQQLEDFAGKTVKSTTKECVDTHSATLCTTIPESLRWHTSKFSEERPGSKGYTDCVKEGLRTPTASPAGPSRLCRRTPLGDTLERRAWGSHTWLIVADEYRDLQSKKFEGVQSKSTTKDGSGIYGTVFRVLLELLTFIDVQ